MYNENFKTFMYDTVFKEAFYYNQDALKDLLECLLGLKKNTLKDVKLDIKYESYLKRPTIYDKNRRCDMLINIKDLIINLEFYTSFYMWDGFKSVVYVQRLIDEQKIDSKTMTLNPQNKNKLLVKKVVQFNIIQNNHYLTKNKIIHNYNYRDKNDNEDTLIADYCLIYCIDIDTNNNLKYNLDTRTSKWIKFLKAKNFQEMKKISKGDEVFMKLFAWLKNYYDKKATQKYFHEWSEANKYLSGHEDGITEGISIGKNEGIAEEKISNATNMLKKNIDENTITEVTGLSLKEVKALKTTLL